MATEQTATRIIVFGATGNLGHVLTREALVQGNPVTAYVRNRSKLVEQFAGSLPSGLSVIEGDALDEESVGKAIEGHAHLINTAGNANDGDSYVRVCQTVMRQSVSRLRFPRRAWFLGGVAALDFADTGVMGVDCPGVPLVYANHKTNYLALKATDLDWSLMCPGPMVHQSDKLSTTALRITTDVMPFDYPAWVNWVPRIGLALTLKKNMPTLTVTFGDVAKLMLANLTANGQYSRKRIGLAKTAR